MAETTDNSSARADWNKVPDPQETIDAVHVSEQALDGLEERVALKREQSTANLEARRDLRRDL